MLQTITTYLLSEAVFNYDTEYTLVKNAMKVFKHS